MFWEIGYCAPKFGAVYLKFSVKFLLQTFPVYNELMTTYTYPKKNKFAV